MDAFWWIGQVGILLEISGAVVLIVDAVKSSDIGRATEEELWRSIDGGTPRYGRVLDYFGNLAKRQWPGFALLAIGLAGQFVANLAPLFE